MARTQRTRKKAGRPRKGDWNGYDERELLSLITHFLCAGHPPAEIRKLLTERYRIELRREEPWDLVRKAAKHGWFHLWPPLDDVLGNRIADRYGLGVDVARTASAADVFRRGADKLLRSVKRLHRWEKKEEVHIGFAGGGALKETARFLAELLLRDEGPLPRQIAFHALVAGFDAKNPSTDPNAFFSYFDVETMPVETKFVGLPAPALLTERELEILGEVKLIKDALEMKNRLDIIVTSAGGHWKKRHSGLSQAYKEYASNIADEDLDEILAEVRADIMWQPIGEHGPVDVGGIDRRAFTLMRLTELGDFIARGKKVLLLFGPCGGCGLPKTEALKAILDCEARMVTDLIVDTRTAKELLA